MSGRLGSNPCHATPVQYVGHPPWGHVGLETLVGGGTQALTTCQGLLPSIQGGWTPGGDPGLSPGLKHQLFQVQHSDAQHPAPQQADLYRFQETWQGYIQDCGRADSSFSVCTLPRLRECPTCASRIPKMR